MLPDLDSLRCFEAAATLLNFRAASRKVSLSPAAFSDRIRNLEGMLGTRLFERTTRRVSLTPAGERMLGQARRALFEARACVEAARAEGRESPYSLTLGTRFELGLSWLTPALSVLEAEAPERVLHLYFGDSADLLAQVERGVIDAAITSVRLARQHVDHALLHEEFYVFCATPRVLKGAPMNTPRDATSQILIDVHTEMPLFRYFAEARPPGEVWSFKAVRALGTIAAVRHQLLAHRGIGVLPHYFAKPELESGRLVRLFAQTELRPDFFRLIWRSNHPRANKLAQLAERLREFPLQ